MNILILKFIYFSKCNIYFICSDQAFYHKPFSNQIYPDTFMSTLLFFFMFVIIILAGLFSCVYYHQHGNNFFKFQTSNFSSFVTCFLFCSMPGCVWVCSFWMNRHRNKTVHFFSVGTLIYIYRANGNVVSLMHMNILVYVWRIYCVREREKKKKELDDERFTQQGE